MDEDRLTEEEERDMPEASFSQFVFMQYQQAKMMLGEIANPLVGKNQVNLPMARYTIDVLALIEEKTKGNLSEDESKLLADILHDLRIGYVYQEQAKSAKTETGKEEGNSTDGKSADRTAEKTDDRGDSEGQ